MKFWFFGWRDFVVKHGENKKDDSFFSFKDFGTILPFGLTKWEHTHEIVKVGEDIKIVDNLDFNGVEKYEVKGEALSDADVIKYITRVKETNLFENVVLEKSSIATEGSTIKTFVMKIIIKPELINSQLVDSETIEEETSE